MSHVLNPETNWVSLAFMTEIKYGEINVIVEWQEFNAIFINTSIEQKSQYEVGSYLCMPLSSALFWGPIHLCHPFHLQLLQIWRQETKLCKAPSFCVPADDTWCLDMNLDKHHCIFAMPIQGVHLSLNTDSWCDHSSIGGYIAWDPKIGSWVNPVEISNCNYASIFGVNSSNYCKYSRSLTCGQIHNERGVRNTQVLMNCAAIVEMTCVVAIASLRNPS